MCVFSFMAKRKKYVVNFSKSLYTINSSHLKSRTLSFLELEIFFLSRGKKKKINFEQIIFFFASIAFLICAPPNKIICTQLQNSIEFYFFIACSVNTLYKPQLQILTCTGLQNLKETGTKKWF